MEIGKLLYPEPEIIESLQHEFMSCYLFSVVFFSVIYAFKYLYQWRSQRLSGTPITIQTRTMASWILLTTAFLGSYSFAVNNSEYWKAFVHLQKPKALLYVVYTILPMTVFIVFLFHLAQNFFVIPQKSRMNAFSGYTLAALAAMSSIILVVFTIRYTG